jgi:hypothetical protein
MYDLSLSAVDAMATSVAIEVDAMATGTLKPLASGVA